MTRAISVENVLCFVQLDSKVIICLPKAEWYLVGFQSLGLKQCLSQILGKPGSLSSLDVPHNVVLVDLAYDIKGRQSCFKFFFGNVRVVIVYLIDKLARHDARCVFFIVFISAWGGHVLVCVLQNFYIGVSVTVAPLLGLIRILCQAWHQVRSTESIDVADHLFLKLWVIL